MMRGSFSCSDILGISLNRVNDSWNDMHPQQKILLLGMSCLGP